jgi:hypothetical protein
LPISEFLPYAQVGGTFAAAIGLFISAWQFWRNRKAATLQHLQDFFKSMNEREAALAAGQGDARRQVHAFVEYLNFLEVYSAAVNDKLFIGVAKELVSDKIIDSLVILDATPEWHDQIESSITSKVTYKHIAEFIARNRRTFDARKSAVRETDSA